MGRKFNKIIAILMILSLMPVSALAATSIGRTYVLDNTEYVVNGDFSNARLSTSGALEYEVIVPQALNLDNFQDECIIKVETRGSIADEKISVQLRNSKGNKSLTEVDNWGGIRNTFKVKYTDIDNSGKEVSKTANAYYDFEDLFHRGGFRGESDYFAYTLPGTARFFVVNKSDLVKGTNTFRITKLSGDKNIIYEGIEMGMYHKNDEIQVNSVIDGNAAIVTETEGYDIG